MKVARNAWSLTKETFVEWSQDNVSRLAAALAYYTIFSLAPLLVIVIAVAGQVAKRTYGDPEVAKTAVFEQVDRMMGPQAADAIANMVKNAAQMGSGWMMVVGIGLLLYASTNVFASLQDSLNTIWEVKPRPGLGIVATLRARLLSFAMVLGIAFLLMVSMVISTVLSVLTKYLGGDTSVLLRLAEQVVSLGIYTLIFAAIYKVLPDVKIGWRSVWVGAILTSVLFTVGKYFIGLYLGRSSTTSVYGTAGSLVLVLLWIYYASQILFFGAEFTQVYSRRRLNARIKPAENAVKLTEADRIKQGMPHQKTIEKAVEAADRKTDLTPRKPVGSGGTVTYMAGAAGLVAGFVIGGVARVLRSSDSAVKEAAAQRVRERIRMLYARVKQGENVARYLREAEAMERLDLMEKRVRRISDCGLRNADWKRDVSV